MRFLPLAPVALGTALSVTTFEAQGSDPVMEWNQIALTATADNMPPQGPLPQLRTMTLVHVAVHDAVNGITREFKPYGPVAAAPPGASAKAAAIAAAHHVLAAVFPARSAFLTAARAASFAAHGTTEADPGVAFGIGAATSVLQRASMDGFANAQFPYTAPGAGNPGVWVPVGEAPVVLPGLGTVTPWVLSRGSQFRPAPPPPLPSATYARDYAEVKSLGSLHAAIRTAEQTGVAKFWYAPPAVIWTRVARQVLDARRPGLSGSARTFGLMYLAAADTSIACWDAKFTFNYWRPITAIRQADRDGNDDTAPDPAWQPLADAHQHPEYPDGHAAHSAAMATILIRLFGDDPGLTLVATSPSNSGFQRRWKTFSQGIDDVIDGRVFAGFDYRNSGNVGADLGRQVATLVSSRALGPDRRR
jgi:hypothetical protein